MSYFKLKKLFEEQSILNDINGLLNWDMATYMPKKSRGERIKQIKKIYDYKKKIFDEIKSKELLKKAEQDNLNSSEELNFYLMKEKLEYFEIIPYEKIKERASLSIDCEGHWRDAKIKSDFNIVKKSFKKLIKTIREESEILSQIKKKNKYDCLITNYDRSLDCEKITKIFKRVEKFIKRKLPLIFKKQNTSNKYFISNNLTEEEQFQLSKVLMNKLGFDFNRGRIDKSLHPFCGGSSNDIRITTRFNKNDSFSCFDALMHETGHGLYEQNLPKKWQHQPLGSAGGMSLHESQSLFVEMQLIKSLPTSRFIEKVLKTKMNRDLGEFNYKNIYRFRNKVKKSFIRVDADEVHYPLHIIHRFNVEKKIIEENADVESLPDLWNEEFSKIFNYDVDSDNNGCLQDIHWYGGDFGYFPTYSIGAIIAAQLMSKIKEEVPDVNSKLENGNFKLIIKWLNEKFHKKGNFYKINDLLELITGEKLNIKYYENHITERYLKEIY